MSVNSIPTSGIGSSYPATKRTADAHANDNTAFADWLNQFQNASQSAPSSNTSTGQNLPVDLSKATAGFAAHLPSGLTIGMVALGPVSSGALQQMAQSVEQEVVDAEKGTAGSSVSWTDTPTGTGNNASAVANAESGPVGMYDILPNGVELMAYSAGTAKGGPATQDMANEMDLLLANLEKALGSGTAA